MRWLLAVAILLGCWSLAVGTATMVTDKSHRLVCDAQAAKGRVGGSDGAGILNLSSGDLDRLLDTAHQAGMWAIRVDVDWSRVEPGPGQQHWEDLDRVVRAVTSRGMCVLGLVAYTPGWATDPADHATDTHYRPADPKMFAEFARTAAQRYLGLIAVWEVWNEPNALAFFKPAPDPAAYGELLSATYTALKSVSADNAVISGGLAPAADNGRDISPTTFLAKLYAGGYNRFFDGFGIHPYSYPALPNAPGTGEWNTALRLGIMYDTMARGGDGDKKVWITECGAPTGTADVAVSEQDQAQTLQIMLARARDTPWIGPAFVYSIRDGGDNRAEPEDNFGIIKRNFSPKPAYAVVQRFGSETP